MQKNKEKLNTKKSENSTMVKSVKKPFIISIIIICIALIISIIFNVLQGIYVGSLQKNITQTFLKEYDIEINENSNTIQPISLLGNIIGGVRYNEKITLNCNKLIKNQLVRVKIEMTNFNNQKFDININTNNWLKGIDGYYYYNQSVKNGDSIVLCNNLEIPQNATLQAKSQNNILTILVESIDENMEIKNIKWPNAPKLI